MSQLVNFQPQSDAMSRSAYVISAAASLFLRDGIEAVRMTDIAEAAGIGVATLYRHYQTKTALAIRAGAHIWQRFNERILALVETDGFIASCGATRLTMLLSEYRDAYLDHPDFVRFLDEFDHMVIRESVAPADLSEYGQAIDSFYVIFEDAYQLGIADGSVTRRVDFAVFYRTIAHAMMAIAQKIVRGEIIPSDDFSKGTDELECIVQMARFTLGITE